MGIKARRRLNANTILEQVIEGEPQIIPALEAIKAMDHLTAIDQK